jgi:hypothetical protein
MEVTIQLQEWVSMEYTRVGGLCTFMKNLKFWKKI